jgi:hypothetical protein
MLIRWCRNSNLVLTYQYKPEAQAKVFQMPVYHPHIIPSLALQAYNARNTVQSRINIRRLMDPKEVGPSASSGTRLKVGEGGQGAGAYNFLLHINTSLKRKRRFSKCPFTIHTLFLRLRFRLISQERLWVRAHPTYYL